MLKIGAQDITGMYVGGTKIRKAYLGEDLIFGGKNPSRLPEGYSEVQYIVVPMDAFVNLGKTIYISKTSRVVRKIELLALDSSAVNIQNFYAIGGSYLSFYIARVSGSENSIFYRLSSYSNTGTVQVDNTKPIIIDVDFNHSKAEIGDNVIDVPQVSTSCFFYVFNTGASYNTNAPQKFYSLQLYSSDELKLDLVPCVNPDNVVGLYDLVSDAFYNNTSNVGTPFIAGPAV